MHRLFVRGGRLRPSLGGIVVVAFGAAALPGDAATLSAGQPLQIQASVPVRCKISPPASGGSANTTFSANGSGGDLYFTQFAGTDAMTRTSQASVRVPIACAGAYVLTVTSRGGLTNETGVAAQGGFLNHVDYTLSAGWNGNTQTRQTAGADVTIDLSQAGAQSGDLNLVFTVPAGRGPLAAGSYADEITIQLNAQ